MDEAPSPRRSRNAYLRWAVLTVPPVLILGWVSGRIGDSGYGNIWFTRLDKPAIMPPGWVFGFTSSILYIMMAAALAFILEARGAKGRAIAIALFVIQFALNLGWAPVFFALHRVMLAFGLLVAILMWAGITTIVFWQIRRIAGLLMLPYLAWLLFAAFLNWQIHILNPWGPAVVPLTGDAKVIVQ